MKKDITVIDFFCGAGGFSEGFRQQGFKVIMGIDVWQPAINTHNLNHGLQDTTKSVLDFWSENTENVSEIEALHDSDGIIGSPPCVSFSSSNKSGNADKTLGIKLIESFLRVVAVKKHKKNSNLKFWYMENVPNSRSYVKEIYTFEMLNLSQWAKSIGKKPDDEALRVQENGQVLNSGNYGAPQSRLRYIAGEWCSENMFVSPEVTHANHITLGDILSKFPKPNISQKEVLKRVYTDPNYPDLNIEGEKLTDHFYDTGLYKIEWYDAQYFKKNHSYMGKMSFPENMDRPCRTIMATRSAKTRESLILKSEYKRVGDGEYRLPTIREAASLMGFPFNYQFTGSEGSKWRQIGNAVSPHLSSALAKAIRKKMGLKPIAPKFQELNDLYKNIDVNLNVFKEQIFNNPKKRIKNAKFRRHPYKSGNMTVELMNYLEDKNSVVSGKDWYLKLYFGTGKDHKQQLIQKNDYANIVKFLEKNIEDFQDFKKSFESTFHTVIGLSKKELQKNYESDLKIISETNPLLIVEKIGEMIENRKGKDVIVKTEIVHKNDIPLGQLYAIYCLGKFIF